MHACWCSDVIEDAGNQLIEHLGSSSWYFLCGDGWLLVGQVVVGEMMWVSWKQT